jgi:catechol 2,3-dioxygenase-like lactoylglutathione lyase family enzyme
MIGYVTLGSNDLARAGAFYDALLAEIGAKRVMDFPTGIVWSIGPGAPALSVMKPFDGNPATVGNGVMVGLAAASPEQVRRLHARALELGGRDEGPPGPRPSGFYVGYFRDLDGNKLNWFCPGQAQP